MELTEKNISSMLGKIPTFSQSAIRILELTSDVDFSTKELVNQIGHDPILTLRVLRLVNSSYFGLSREVTSIQHGVVYIGANTVKNLAISVAAMGALPSKNEAGLEMDQFWLHSLTTAVVCRQIASIKKTPKAELSSYFISGLLHDIGKIIFSQALPNEYKQVLEIARESSRPIHEIEQEIFSVNHAELGAMLGDRWQLPPAMVDSIRHHHCIERPADESQLKKALYAANHIVNLQEYEDDGIYSVEKLPDSIESWMAAPVDEFVLSLGDLSSELENAKHFVQLS